MTTGYRRPTDRDALKHNFRVFADADCAHEPLYAALSRAVADDPATLDLLLEAPYAQRRPVLLFAATHDLLLAGAEHPVRRFYRTVAAANERSDDVEDAAPAFVDFCRMQRDALRAMLATRATQTNEVGRAAGLRLALAEVGAERAVALIDVGCSAGLNLLVDRYRFAYRLPRGDVATAGPESDVVVTTDVTHAPDVTASIAPIARRVGIDRAPLDVRDARDARWLAACVWPSDDERHARLAAAIAIAERTPLDLLRGDALECLPDVLSTLPADSKPVVFHSWVVSYFDGDARRRFVDTMHAMIAAKDGAWISAEAPGVVPGLERPWLAPDADAAHREATVWHLTTRTGTRVLARSHPHCRWIEWL